MECLEHGGGSSSPLSYYNERWMLSEPKPGCPVLCRDHLVSCANALSGAMWPPDGNNFSGKKTLDNIFKQGKWKVAAGPVDFPVYIFNKVEDGKREERNSNRKDNSSSFHSSSSNSNSNSTSNTNTSNNVVTSSFEDALPMVVIPFETSYFQPKRMLLPRQINPPYPVYYSINPDTPKKACFSFHEWDGEVQ